MTSLDKQELSQDRAVFYARPVSYAYEGSAGLRNLDAGSANDTWDKLSTRSGVRLGSYLEIPFIYKGLLLKCLFGFIFAGWLTLMLMPRTYESEAKLMLKVGRESVSLDPTATTSQTLMLQKTQEEEITSALEVLSSREVAQQVVERIGADAIMSGYLPGDTNGTVEQSWVKSQVSRVKGLASDALHFVLLTAGVRDSISNQELAVLRLKGAVGIYASKKSTVIAIDATAKSPELAQAIVQATTDVFLEQHAKVSQTAGSHDFFTTQSLESEQRLTSLVNQKCAMLQNRQIVSVSASQALLNERLTAIDRDAVAAKADLEQATAEIEDLLTKLDTTENEIVAAKTEQSDSTWSGMRQRVYELELEEKSLAAKYTARHQRLIETRDQLEGARLILAKLKSDRVDQSMTPNPAKQRMQEDLQRLQTRVVGLRSIMDEKQRQRSETQQEIHDLLKFELELTQMDRDIALLEGSLQTLQEKQEEARVLDELRAKKISNVSVFQPATFVQRPIKPNKKVLAAGFVMMGLISGMGLAFLAEATSSTLRTTEHVEANLRYPVVMKIPQVRESRFIGRFIRSADQNPMRPNCQSILSDVLLSRGRPIRNELRGRTLGVIGVDAGCGASTLAAALALASSDDCGLKTTLIDGDSQGRTVSKAFGLNGAPGLMELVSGDASHDDCVQQFDQSDLSLISYSAPTAKLRIDSDPRDVLLALQEFSQTSDLVIIDLPPASNPDQTIGLAKHLDHVLVVVESERTEIAAAERLLRRISGGNAQVVGIVLNKTNNRLPNWLGKLVNA